MESADRIRRVIAELKGKLVERKNRDEVAREHVPRLAVSDCRWPVGDVPAVETIAWGSNSPLPTSHRPSPIRLVGTSTSSMLADCLTKRMKPA